MAVHDNIGSRKDPHMKSPMPGFIVVVIVVAILAFVGYKAYEIIGQETDETEERAKDGKQSDTPPREK